VTHEFEDDSLAFVRDIFVFVCFTALSFIDVKELTTDNIMDINGDKWIIGHRHKTGIPFQVKTSLALSYIYRQAVNLFLEMSIPTHCRKNSPNVICEFGFILTTFKGLILN